MNELNRVTIFVASAMRNEQREVINKLIDSFNSNYKAHYGVEFEACIYGQTMIADAAVDTQKSLDRRAATCDLFVLLAENGVTLGEYTVEEYRTAHEQALRSVDAKPLIKAFLIKSPQDRLVNIPYRELVDGVVQEFSSFEERLDQDSKRYMQVCNEADFGELFLAWLKAFAADLGNSYVQNEISYGAHIDKNSQGGVRAKNKIYYRREAFDGKIEEILQRSPLLILEGRTYSGKTRAAFEVMCNNPEWSNYDFHLFNNSHTVEDLNRLNLDFTSTSKGDVYLLDDINDILSTGGGINRHSSLWAQLNGFNGGRGYTKEAWGKTRIIITVSGKLSDEGKQALYRQLFNTEGYEYERNLERIRVDFDICDKLSFKAMVDEMVRDGVIHMRQVRPGNYTIGSLFIRTEDLRSKIDRLLSVEASRMLLVTLSHHWKYAVSSHRHGDFRELCRLQNFLFPNKRWSDQELALQVDALRRDGLLLVEGGDTSRKAIIDTYVREVVEQAVAAYKSNRMQSAPDYTEQKMLENLINYAPTMPDEEDDEQHSIEQMGYWLCDRNALSDEQLYFLIDYVYSKVVKEAYLPAPDNQERLWFLITICDELKTRYATIFCAAAIARLDDFNAFETLLSAFENLLQEPIRDAETPWEVIENLYKQLVYTRFSDSCKSLTMQQERKLLNRIFTKDEASQPQWRKPFGEQDLKDVFDLVRICSYAQFSPSKIVSLAEKSTLDGYELPKRRSAADRYRRSTAESVSGLVIPDRLYQKVFLPQLAKAAMQALRATKDYAAFEQTMELLQQTPSEHLVRATGELLDRLFYAEAHLLAQQYSYEDRYKLFNYILHIDDQQGVVGNHQYETKVNPFRVHALNRLLETLDEHDALEAYGQMTLPTVQLYDMRTFSHLLKNEFLGLEHLIHICATDSLGIANNFLTQNQLMVKAETETDARACMRLMNIQDGDPVKLRDEMALTQYLKIKSVDHRKCIEILKQWRQRFPEKLFSDQAMNTIIRKLTIAELMDIFLKPTTDVDFTDDYFKQHYGVKLQEVESIRVNPLCLSVMFYKANAVTNQHPDCAAIHQKMQDKFEEIMANNPALITDPEQNVDNSILAVYIKDKWCFPTYDQMTDWLDAFLQEEPCRTIRKTSHLYANALWWIGENKQSGQYTRAEAIDKMNEVLQKAYRDSAARATRKETIREMSYLYQYRIALVEKGDFFEPQPYAYEEQIVTCTFEAFLQLLCSNGTTAYVSDTFIYNGLCSMYDGCNDRIYDLLGQIAYTNRRGVRYDSLFSKGFGAVRHKLISITHPSDQEIDIRIDGRFVFGMSLIKLICVLWQKNKINFEQGEDYRQRMRIPITQTYLNMAFNRLKQDYVKDYTAKSAQAGYDAMLDLMQLCGLGRGQQKNDALHKSIQMCVAMIGVAPDERALDEIFTTHGFGQFRDRTEAVGARMNRILNLRYKSTISCHTIAEFNQEMIANRHAINSTIVNTYFHSLLRIIKGELKDADMTKEHAQELMHDCWVATIRPQRKVDMNQLLEIRGADFAWVIDANVQTFSYFAAECPTLISTMEHEFEGDFTYDENRKKSCLKDALKNYAYSYTKRYYDELPDIGQELVAVASILRQDQHRSVFCEVRKEFLDKTTKDSWKWAPFWFDLKATLSK